MGGGHRGLLCQPQRTQSRRSTKDNIFFIFNFISNLKLHYKTCQTNMSKNRWQLVPRSCSAVGKGSFYSATERPGRAPAAALVNRVQSGARSDAAAERSRSRLLTSVRRKRRRPRGAGADQRDKVAPAATHLRLVRKTRRHHPGHTLRQTPRG